MTIETVEIVVEYRLEYDTREMREYLIRTIFDGPSMKLFESAGQICVGKYIRLPSIKCRSKHASIIEWIKVQRMKASQDYKEYKRRYGPCADEMWRTEGVKEAFTAVKIEIEERMYGRST